MIFSPELLPKVLDGSKTVTRRRCLSEHDFGCAYKVGRTYAVQPCRTCPGIARLCVLSVRRERFSDLTADEARLEGFKDASEMRMWWTLRYGAAAYDAPVWRIEFFLSTPPEQKEQMTNRD